MTTPIRPTVPSLLAFLEEQKADSDTIQQATRLYLAERTDDAAASELKDELVEASGDAAKVDAALKELNADRAAVEAACLAFLSDAWKQPGEAEKIASAVLHAKEKLPVVEAFLITIMTMYAMYLVATDGVKSETEEITRKPDGTLVIKRRKENESPVGPLSVVSGLFTAWRGGKKGGGIDPEARDSTKPPH